MTPVGCKTATDGRGRIRFDGAGDADTGSASAETHGLHVAVYPASAM